MEQSEKKEIKTLSNHLRIVFRDLLNAVGSFLNKIGLTPNVITLIGLIGNIGGSVVLAMGFLTWGAIIVLLMGLMDVIDGTMARLRGEANKMGSFIDSITDRYSELFIFGGLMIYYINQQAWMGCVLVFAASAGSILVSYVRAKAESLGYEAQIGILTRFERYLVLVPALLFQHPEIGLGIIAILGNFTALQRIIHVLKQCHRNK